MKQKTIKELPSQQKYQCIHQIIEYQTIKVAGKTAIVIGNERLTYGQLNTLANKLAHHLQSLGIGPNKLVGLFAERSPEVVIGILGILKAGGAYVPLDPKYPKDRITYVLQDAQVSILLTQEKLVKNLPDNVYRDNVKIVYLDSDSISHLQLKEENPASDVRPSDLAFVVYTSGTTGKPRGVMTTHANMCSYVHALADRLGIFINDRYLHTASIAFSSSNRQLMLPFSVGGTVIMTTSEERMNPLSMFKVIKSQGVTVIDLVPAHMRSCIKALNQLDLKTRTSLLGNDLRMILSASEALLSDIPQNWRKIFKQKIKYVNMYGLTETTGIITTYEIPSIKNKKLKVVPIGSAINGMDTYILDQDMKSVSESNTGILYVSGSNLTLGYLNQPELTNNKFIPNPFYPKHESRLFRTGDLCRYNLDGFIEYIGRADHQIKINGIRIEPKEIELLLNRHPVIHESIIVTKEFRGEKYLVAYFVENESSNISVTELKKMISKELPAHMMPSYFVRIDSLPLTPNGKIDRFALPELSPDLICSNSILIGPRTHAEKTLVNIWGEVLGVKRIGVYNNYFELGGNSLLGFQIISRIYNTFKVNLSASVLFEYPTVASLAEYLEVACGNVRKNVVSGEKRNRGII